MNYLFICTNNEIRSPTAEKVFRKMLKENKKKGNVKSAGVAPDAPNRITYQLLQWAGKIFCMEEEHKLYITYLYPELEKKIMVLNILDIYQRNDLELVTILKERLSAKI
ncbi:MAG TPA: phosphotyrosine protein phosphatase [Candidatus Nanoarchaeia archaeon]|nr:phosphotyrosine protein phosphatase [Candidatus Nanoarchaeia archaeon]